MTAEQRVWLVAGAWTLATAVCAITVASLAHVVGHVLSRPSIGGSGPAGTVAIVLGWAFLALGVVATLVVPVGVAAYRHRTGAYDRLTAAAWTVAALALFPTAVGLWWAYGVDDAWFLASVVVGVGALGVALTRGDGDRLASIRRLVPAQSAHVALAVVLLAGSAGGIALGATLDSHVTDDRIGGIVPQIDFDATYTATDDGRGVITVSHDAGQPVRADRLRVDGTGFAAVDGVDHTSSGPWNGSVSGADGRVVEGDSVTVGVAGDCRIRIVYVDGGQRNTIGQARCAELRP